MFLCIEKLTIHEVMMLASYVLPCCHRMKSVTDGHLVPHDLFIYYLNEMGVKSKMVVKMLIGAIMAKLWLFFYLHVKKWQPQ